MAEAREQLRARATAIGLAGLSDEYLNDLAAGERRLVEVVGKLPRGLPPALEPVHVFRPPSASPGRRS
ncbi:MAG: hypothetical protein FJX68_13400 [Alphaproteobacteria bacterium]|nr:hypothetical protein [Alphaproteobacteria bacterium]